MNNMYNKTTILEPFLKDNQDLINNNKWEEIYNLLNSKDRFLRWGLNNITIGWFTELMLNCGINPLSYMDHVPQNFLNSIDLTNSTYLETPGTFIIPDNIKKIDFNAFYNIKGLSDLILPEDLEMIEDHSLPTGTNLNLHIKSVEKFLKVKFGEDNLNPLLYPLENIRIICDGDVIKSTYNIKIDTTTSNNYYPNSWTDIANKKYVDSYIDKKHNNSYYSSARWNEIKTDIIKDWVEF